MTVPVIHNYCWLLYLVSRHLDILDNTFNDWMQVVQVGLRLIISLRHTYSTHTPCNYLSFISVQYMIILECCEFQTQATMEVTGNKWRYALKWCKPNNDDDDDDDGSLKLHDTVTCTVITTMTSYTHLSSHRLLLLMIMMVGNVVSRGVVVILWLTRPLIVSATHHTALTLHYTQWVSV